jgi:hypothetical protein
MVTARARQSQGRGPAGPVPLASGCHRDWQWGTARVPSHPPLARLGPPGACRPTKPLAREPRQRPPDRALADCRALLPTIAVALEPARARPEVAWPEVASGRYLWLVTLIEVV